MSAAAVTALLVCARLLALVLVAANTYYYEVVIICKRRQTSRMIEWDRVPTWKRVHFAFEGFAVPVKKFSDVLKVVGLSRKPLILISFSFVPGWEPVTLQWWAKVFQLYLHQWKILHLNGSSHSVSGWSKIRTRGLQKRRRLLTNGSIMACFI